MDASRIESRDGYVDTGGAIIYYSTIGTGPPLVLLHGGPGATHADFLPHLLPLARRRQLVLIDERGCGRSQQFEDHSQYSLATLAHDIESVRLALDLGQIDLLGHSFGGILAQAVAINYPAGIRRLIIAGSGSSAARINADFEQIKSSVDENVRAQIDALEARGVIGADGAQLPEYRALADKAEASYLYAIRPPAWDSARVPMGWDVLNQIWGGKSDFRIDGSLAGFDFTEALRKLKIPALVIYGDHDMVSDATAQESHAALAGSVLVRIPRCAHMMMVDQNTMFIDAITSFLEQ